MCIVFLSLPSIFFRILGQGKTITNAIIGLLSKPEYSVLSVGFPNMHLQQNSKLFPSEVAVQLISHERVGVLHNGVTDKHTIDKLIDLQKVLQ